MDFGALVLAMFIPVLVLINCCDPVVYAMKNSKALKNTVFDQKTFGKKKTSNIKVDPKGVVIGGLGGMALEKLRQLGMDEVGHTIQNYYNKLEILD